MQHGLSAILPAHNERENIEAAVRRTLDAVSGIADDHEVIVVNDGSSDNTAEIVAPLVAELHPRVRLVSHVEQRGYGAALRTGFAFVRYGAIFYTDADNQFDPAELVYFMPLLEEHDVVLGFRVYRYDSVLRCILSWIYNRLVSVLFRVRVRDVDCAFKLFRREVLDQIWIEADDFFVDTEIVARARKWNFRIVEKGVRHYPRMAGETTVRSSDVSHTLRTMARMWRRVYFPSPEQRAMASRQKDEAKASAVELVPAAR